MVGSAGLLALVPIAVLMVSGRLGVVQGAQRAAVVLVVTVVLGRLVSAYVRSVASGLQTSGDLDELVGARGAGRPQER